MEIMIYIAAFGKSALLVIATILPIVNPPAIAPTFLSMTEGSRRMRTPMSKNIGKNVALTLIGAMIIGTYVLDFFGISLPIVRVAGGMLVASAAWRMLSASGAEDNRSGMAETFTAEMVRARAFYPLTFPLTCGPGSIAAALTIGATLRDKNWLVTTANFAGGVLGACAIGAVVYFTYRFARHILKPLGETGVIVFLRMSAFILLCVGVQIIWEGIKALIKTV